jgi:hypothetical protein
MDTLFPVFVARVLAVSNKLAASDFDGAALAKSSVSGRSCCGTERAAPNREVRRRDLKRPPHSNSSRPECADIVEKVRKWAFFQSAHLLAECLSR